MGKIRIQRAIGIVAGLTLCISGFASAAYKGRVSVNKVYVGQYISFAVNSPPADTCSLYGRQFKFSGTTESGKNLLAMLLAAEMAGKDVDLWYGASDKPGSDQTTGCDSGNMAVIYSIGFSD